MCKLLLLVFVSFSMSACLKGMEPLGSVTSGSGTPTTTYSWVEGAWGACSATTCGTTGTRTRTVVCEDSDNNTVADSFCITSVGPKPQASQSCSAPSCPSASCNLPWGGTIASGSTVTAYAASSVPHGQSCVSQTRTCTNGTLSGSYTHSSCTVENPQPPTGNGIVVDLSYVNTSSSKYTRFKEYVDMKLNGGNPYNFAGADAAYMYKITNQNQYCTLAVNHAEEQVVAAENAMNAGNAAPIAFDSYLYSGEHIADIAYAYDWCRTFMTSQQRTRWENYANQTIFNIWNHQQASWGGRPFPWTGWSTNNPGNNYYYSFTEATMLWGLASNNTATINIARNKLNAAQAYFANLPGGGSLEGSGYGSSHRRLFEVYKIWRASVGDDYGNMNSHLTDSIRYWTHITIPSRDHFAPIGDQAGRRIPIIFDYHRMILLYARDITSDSAAKDLASWWLNHISVQQMGQLFTRRHDLLDPGTNTASAPNEPLIYHARGVGQIFARTGWDTNAFWMQFGAGKFNESHASQSQGGFTLANNSWLSVTSNIWSSSGIIQSTDVYNILRFENNGSIIPQRFGTESSMTINSQNPNTGAINITANLATAYYTGSGTVPNPNIQTWTRNVDFANRSLLVNDNYTVSASTQAIFQINVPVQPTRSGNTITAGGLTITIETPSNPTVTFVDMTTQRIDGNSFSRGYRIDIRGPVGSGQFRVRLSN